MTNIEDQVVSVEVAKRLKEIGVEQESLFYWASGSLLFFEKVDWSNADNTYSAFTVAEMIEKLPAIIEDGKVEYWLRVEVVAVGGGNTTWLVEYASASNEILGYVVKTKLADAVGEMRLWLVKNGYVEVIG